MTLCLAPRIDAPQHERAPRPLPLFLDLVRQVALKDPSTAAAALRGLRAFAAAPEPASREAKPIVHRHRGAALRDCGGSGATVVIVPSPINPPDILDCWRTCRQRRPGFVTRLGASVRSA